MYTYLHLTFLPCLVSLLSHSSSMLEGKYLVTTETYNMESSDIPTGALRTNYLYSNTNYLFKPCKRHPQAALNSV